MKFYKYSATGNDFILIDNRKGIDFTSEQAKKFCTRKKSIGADGLILLGFSKTCDFSMKIFNADGSVAEMCGNGARAICHFAHHILKIKTKGEYIFETMNGNYSAIVLDNFVKLKMVEKYDVNKYSIDLPMGKRGFYINTGVPHFVIEVDHLDGLDVENVAPAIRHHKNFPQGANVDFFEIKNSECYLRTFERGVEGETLACGTGVVATCYAIEHFYGKKDKISVNVRGGKLEVEFINNETWFSGNVDLIYAGEILR